jgi:hypothetical protein
MDAVTTADTFNAETEYPTPSGYPVYRWRNGHRETVAHCRTKSEARTLASTLGTQAQTMRWDEVRIALDGAR